MTYEIQLTEPVGEAVRRIAHEQIDAAIDDLEGIDGSRDLAGSVHDCRKRCKKARGLVRLVRPSVGDDVYSPANAALRDAARQLSGLRDAHALLETFDDLVAATHQLPDGGLGAVRAELARRAEVATASVGDDDERIDRAADLLRATRSRIDDWEPDDDFSGVAGGLRTTYGRGRDALSEAMRAPSPEVFHEWRKRVKYTWYHLRLLTPVAPSVLEPMADRFHDLADALGDAHDLVVLVDQLDSEPDAFGGDEQSQTARLLLDGWRSDLERRAVGLGRRLYAEKPKHLVKRLGTCWEAAADGGAEPDAGEISALAARLGLGTSGHETDGLAQLTVVELHERAGSLEIPGRSAMRRDDLVASLRAADPRTR